MKSDKLSMSGSGTRAGSQEIEDLMKQMHESRTPEAALELARRAVELRPKNPDLRLMLAITLHNQGKAQEAERAYSECLMIDAENLLALINLGSLQISSGQPAAGLKALEGALNLDPDNVQARYHKGRGLGRLGQADEALKIFDELAAEQPNKVEFIKAQALCHMDIGHKTKAAELLFRAAELAPNDKAVRNAMKKVTS